MELLKANGADIPALGLGTYDLRGQVCVDVVSHALNHGYDHVDTAAFYENEEAVGQGIVESGRKRESIFLTTKVWPTEISDGAFQKSVESSLARLGVDQVDLLLIHWPPKDDRVEEWARLLNDAANRGWTKHIGVSNFTISLLDRFIDASERPIVANQIENHPYLDQSKLRKACARHGIALIAYSPLFRGGELFADPVIVAIADNHGKSPAQIVLRWHVQHDLAGAIPKTGTIERLSENLDVFDFALSADEMVQINSLCAKGHRICDFDFSPQWDAV